MRHHLHDPRKHRVPADLVGAHDEAARLVHGAADHLLADALGHRHGFSRHHRFIDGAASFDDFPVDRHALARPHAQAIADDDLIEGHILVRAVGPDPPRHFRGEIKQRADGAAGLLTGLEFENLPKEDKHGDDGSCLEVDRNGAVMAAHRRRKHGRQQGSDDAVNPCYTGAHRDQREHVEIARLEGSPGPLEERPSGPQHDRGRQHELDPVRSLLADPLMKVRQVPAHFEREHRHSQRQAHPEPPRHVDELRIGPRVCRHQLRLERHAADRTRAGARLPDLGMHWACVDRACRDRLDDPRLGLQILSRIGHELVPASGRAEVVRAPIVSVTMLGCVRVDSHAAHGVFNAATGRVATVSMINVGMRCLRRHDRPLSSTLRGYWLTAIPR